MVISESCPICGGAAGKVKCVLRAKNVAVCDNCGGWYRLPRPSASDLKRIYTKEYYDSWSLNHNEQSVKSTKHATFSPILVRIEKGKLSEAGTNKGKILDVGAATGFLLDVATERGWDPYAIELNPYSAGVLREKFGAKRVFEGELADYPGRSEFFDVITMTDVLEHVLDIHTTLKRAAGLLKEGGVLCMTTPRIDSFSRFLLGKKWLHFKEEHLQYFSRRGMVEVLREAGFEQIQISAHYKYLTIAYLHQQLQAFPHPLLTRIITLIHSILPNSLCICPMRFRCGEMLIIGRLSRRKRGQLV